MGLLIHQARFHDISGSGYDCGSQAAAHRAGGMRPDVIAASEVAGQNCLLGLLIRAQFPKVDERCSLNCWQAAAPQACRPLLPEDGGKGMQHATIPGRDRSKRAGTA